MQAARLAVNCLLALMAIVGEGGVSSKQSLHQMQPGSGCSVTL